MKDHSFIQKCLPRLEYSFFNHMIIEKAHSFECSIKAELKSKKLIKHIASIDIMPTKNRIKKYIVYECVMGIFMDMICDSDIDKERRHIITVSQTILPRGWPELVIEPEYQNIRKEVDQAP